MPRSSATTFWHSPTSASRCPRARIALASFLAYAISNNVGFAMLSGASVRYRFYTRWGVTAEELSRIVFSYSVTFWLGLLALGGLSLLVGPLPTAAELPARTSPRACRLAPHARAASLPALDVAAARAAPVQSCQSPDAIARDRRRAVADLGG